MAQVLLLQMQGSLRAHADFSHRAGENQFFRMSQIGQANSELPQALWTAEESRFSSSPSLPGVPLILLVLLVVTVLGGVIMIQSEISTALRQLGETGANASTAEYSLKPLAQIGHYQMAATIFTTLCGVILIGLAVAGFRRVEQRWKRVHEKANDTWNRAARELRAQLIEKKRFEAGLREQNGILQDQLKSVTRAYTEAQQELDQIKLAKEVFAHQRSELVRSKDILELNVQARTHQLQKLQRAYESILNSAGEGICGLDTSGIVTFANPAAGRMMGLKVGEIVGQPVQKAFPAFAGADSTNESSAGAIPAEVTATRYNGTKFEAEFLRTPIREGSRVTGEVLLFKDITERKLAAEELAKKVEELARSNKELEQFAFVASHDLQEPLRKIQAFGDRLKTKCDAAHLQDGHDYLDRMQNAAARMQTLIYDLLTFSRVISRTEPFVPIDLNVVMKEILSDLEVRIERTGGRVEVGELPMVEADATQMRQLLQNLIGNALKFHAQGKPPVVQVRSQKLSSPPAAASDDKAGNDVEWCTITISDNGIGFDEKYLDRIFAVFQRLHGRQEFEGTGIGLAVCRRIVERHGGAITARSKLGEGATFIITMPLQQPDKQEPEA